MPKIENSGCVSFISQVSAEQHDDAEDKRQRQADLPRALAPASGRQRDTRIEMKTTLSMPSTISSTVKVTSAAQAFGSERSSSMAALCMIAARAATARAPGNKQRSAHSAAVIQSSGCKPLQSATSASAAHSASSATVTVRSRRTRNGWTKRTGTKVSTANSAIAPPRPRPAPAAAAADRTRPGSTPPESRGRNCPSVFMLRSAK